MSDDIAIQGRDATFIKVEASLEHAEIESPWTTCYKRDPGQADKAQANGPQMSPLVHNLYKKIADLEHGIELRELESKMVVRTPRHGESSASEGGSPAPPRHASQPRITAPTVIQPISHHNRVHPAAKAHASNDVSQIDSDNSQMLEKLEGLEFQLACEKRDKLRMQREIEQMSEKLSQALQNQDHVPAIAVDLQRELSAERNHVDDLRRQLAAAGVQIKDQQRLLDSMTETLTSLQKENDTLRFSVKEMELKLVRAAGDDSSKSRISDELLATCALMEKRAAEAAALERQLSEAGRQLEEERGRGSRVARELADARRDVDRVEQALKDQRAKTAAAVAESGHLKQELERQSRRLQEQVAKGQGGEREAEAVRAEFRQFRDKAAAHQTKWRAERHSLMVPLPPCCCRPVPMLRRASLPHGSTNKDETRRALVDEYSEGFVGGCVCVCMLPALSCRRFFLLRPSFSCCCCPVVRIMFLSLQYY